MQVESPVCVANSFKLKSCFCPVQINVCSNFFFFNYSGKTFKFCFMCSVFIDQKDKNTKWVMMKTLKSVIQTLF